MGTSEWLVAEMWSTISNNSLEKLKTANIVLPGEFFVVSYKQNFHPKNKSLKNEIYNAIYAADNIMILA